MDEYTTDEIQGIDIVIPPPSLDEPDIRFVDIHIYDQAPEPEPADTQEYQPEPEPPRDDEGEQVPVEPVPPDHTRRTILVLCSAFLCLMALSALVIVYLLPLMTPDTTITIIPESQQLQTTATITVTTGPATRTEIAGRALAAITMSQARTIPTTGKGHQDARAGHGLITFYNAATYPQAVTAGTLLTGADGVQVVTDADAAIPAGTLATNGQATVPAHALQVGSQGNIQAGDIYGPCCRVNVFAANTAFVGGELARDYRTVTAQDITSVATSLKASLNQSVQAAMQTQVQSNETLITPSSCQQSVKPDHQPGEEAAQVNILVSETCRGMTYNTQAYQTQVTHLIQQQAMKQLGDGYTPVGEVQSSILHTTTPNQKQTGLTTSIAQIYAYQITPQQQQQIKAQVAGKSKTQALSILLHTPGMQSVSISSAMIPTDTQHIRVVVIYMG